MALACQRLETKAPAKRDLEIGPGILEHSGVVSRPQREIFA